MNLLQILAALTFILCACTVEASETHPVLVQEGNTILLTDSATGKKVVYHTIKTIRDGALNISPDGTRMAIVETAPGVTAQGNYAVLPRNSLVICDTSGTVLFSIDDDVRKIAWSPDGTKMAYITGSYYEGGLGFRAEGLYLFDLSNGSKKRITKDFPHATPNGHRGSGYDLNWSQHDGNLYIREIEAAGGNYVYDTKSGTTHQVPFKGINFSPDGRYYLAVNLEGDNKVYDVLTNSDLSDTVKMSIPSIPSKWETGLTHHLRFEKITYEDHTMSGEKVEPMRAYSVGQLVVKEKRFYIYDVDQRRVVEEGVEKL